MTVSRFVPVVIVAAGTLLNLACASQTGAVKERRPQIGLRRGGSVSTYTVELPAIVGATAQLRLAGQMLEGFIGGGTLHVKIDDNKGSGFGPSGPIDASIRQQGGVLAVDGLWNGGPAHLVFAETSVKGTVVRFGANVSRLATCGYDLDRRDNGGAFVGMSTCQGLPERTWLDIDERVRGTLKPAELAVLLVTILADPGVGR